MKEVVWIFLGSGTGGAARYLLSSWMTRVIPGPFPVGTFVINVAGSFAITLLMELSLRPGLLPPLARLALVTGVLGGFTTYSAFTYETWSLVTRGAWLTAVLYVLATVAAGLSAGAFGLWLGQQLAA